MSLGGDEDRLQASALPETDAGNVRPGAGQEAAVALDRGRAI